MDENETPRKRQREQLVAAEDFLVEARKIWRRDNPHDDSRSAAVEDRDFREFFGTFVEVVTILWNRLAARDLLPDGGRLEHLLWALMFMKGYNKTKVFSVLCGANKDTAMKWVWSFIDDAIIPLLEDEIVSGFSH
jgi:hypothetical protein